MLEFPDGTWDQIIPFKQDRGGGVIELADGTLVQYYGSGGNKWRWQFRASQMDKDTLDKLEAPVRRPPRILLRTGAGQISQPRTSQMHLRTPHLSYTLFYEVETGWVYRVTPDR